MKRFKGIVPVLLTPIMNSGEVDHAGLVNLVEYYNNEKVSGLWVLGTGGEDMGLSFSQRVEVAQIVTEAASADMKLAVGCSFYSVKESKEFIQETENLGFDCYHSMPYHPKVSEALILDWYKKISDHVSKPLWAYTSGNWAQRISPKMVEELKKLSSIEGVKYSTSNAVDLQEVSLLNDDEFQVISAVIKTFYLSLSLGLEAATSVEATYFLDEIKSVYMAYQSENVELALKLQNELNSILKYPSPAAKDNFLRVAELKYLISKKVSMEPYVTEYYRNLTEEEKLVLDGYV